MTENQFLLGSFILGFMGFFFGWFDNVENVASLGVVFGWLALYSVIKSDGISNKNIDKIDKRFEDINKNL